MKHKKIFKFVFLAFFFAFIGAYLIEKTGYYEYNLQRKKNLTKEQMKKFEADIEKGNEIDLNDYLENTSIDYSNSLTRTTANVSLKLNKTLKIFLKDGFKIFEKFVK